MDKQCLAHLDKTKLKVMCGSCHKQIAGIAERRFQPIIASREGRDRVGYPLIRARELILAMAYEPQPSGIWKLNSRASKRLKQGKSPSVRRQSRVLPTSEFYAVPSIPVWVPSVVQMNAEHPSLPIQAQCFYCSSVQHMLSDKLEVTEQNVCFGSGHGGSKTFSRYVTEEEWREMQPDN